MIELKDICKVYLVGDERVKALDHANLHIAPREFVSIIGPSGSGKSTLMNIIGCLDVADAGTYLLDGLPIESYTENQLAKIRNQKIGFVFQSFNLIPKLSAEENVELPLIYQKVPKAQRQQRVKEALERVNLSHRAKHLPTELSGGQQQRVAIARTLMQKAPILIFDDSMSAVDTQTDAKIRDALYGMRRDGVVFIISHRITTLCEADKILVLDHGKLVQQGTHNELIEQEGLYRRIAVIQDALERRSRT